MTADELTNKLSYLLEETELDPEVGKPEYAVLKELLDALNAAESGQQKPPQSTQRIDKAYKKALEVLPAEARSRPPSHYVPFLLHIAASYLGR